MRAKCADQMLFGFGGVDERKLSEQVSVPAEGDGNYADYHRDAKGAADPDVER